MKVSEIGKVKLYNSAFKVAHLLWAAAMRFYIFPKGNRPLLSCHFSLVLKVRVFGTRKWPTGKDSLSYGSQSKHAKIAIH